MISKMFISVLVIWVLVFGVASAQTVRVEAPSISGEYYVDPGFLKNLIEWALGTVGLQVTQSPNCNLCVQTSIRTDIAQAGGSNSNSILNIFGSSGYSSGNYPSGTIVMKILNTRTGNVNPQVAFMGELNPDVVRSYSFNTPFGSFSNNRYKYVSSNTYAFQCSEYLILNAVSKLSDRRGEIPAESIELQTNCQNQAQAQTQYQNVSTEATIYVPIRSDVYIQLNYGGWQKVNAGKNGVIKKSAPQGSMITVKYKDKCRVGYPPCEIDLR